MKNIRKLISTTLGLPTGWAVGVQRCKLSAPSQSCAVAYGNAGLLMNIQGIIIINGNPAPIPPH